MAARLALGTAQFGLTYGIANQTGQVSQDVIGAILRTAREGGVDTLDTAIAYGDSEARLGRCDLSEWRVVSKIPHVDGMGSDVSGWLRSAVQGSLDRLRIPRLHAVLLHRPDDLLGPSGDVLYRALLDVRAEGLVTKIGVSVYGPEDLDAIWQTYPLQLVQAPFNVFDRRLETSGWLARLAHEGVEVHTRSAFLQGLLLMDPASRPARFDRWRPRFDQWQQWLADTGYSPVRACLGVAWSRPAIERVIVGIDGLGHLHEILEAAAAEPVSPPESLTTADLDLIHPPLWNHQ